MSAPSPSQLIPSWTVEDLTSTLEKLTPKDHVRFLSPHFPNEKLEEWDKPTLLELALSMLQAWEAESQSHDSFLIRSTASLCRASFEAFVRMFWDEVPVSQPLLWGWHLGVYCSEIQCVAEEILSESPRSHDLICNVSPGSSKSSVWSVLFPCWVWSRKPDARLITASHTEILATDLAAYAREVMRSPMYRLCFPEIEFTETQDAKGYYRNTKGGERFTCTVAGKSPTGHHAHFIICDDPIDPKKVLSEAERKTASDFLTQVIPSRRMRGKRGDVCATMLVMQRLGVDDPTDVMLKVARNEGAVPIRHICLPAEITDDVSPPELKSYYTSYNQDAGVESDGLMDPVRLNRRTLNEQRSILGEWGFCTPGYSPVLMADFSEKKIENVEVGDDLVGYQFAVTGSRTRGGGNGIIVKSKVVAKNRSIRDVVRITMASGRKVYCTSDHMWWTGRSGKDGHQPYLCARTREESRGTRFLMSVYTPLSCLSVEEQRCWDWLGGIMDGEGSCNIQGTLNISQSWERNPEVYEEIGRVLDYVKIPYSIFREEAKLCWRRKRGTKDEYYLANDAGRSLYMLSSKRSVKIRMINYAKMAKRQRIVDSIWKRPCGISEQGRDEVIKIESVGKEEVFNLTTTSGNYIVWGYASKNCGQYLQKPRPIAGGMFKRRYLQYAPSAPLRCKRIRYWDRASGREVSACATAGTLVAYDGERIYIEDVVYGKWEPDERNDVILATAHKDRMRYGKHEPIIYIEAEGGSSGRDAWLGIVRKLMGYPVREDRVQGSKDTRAEPWATQWSAKNVYLVDNGEISNPGTGGKAGWDIESWIIEHENFRPEPGKKLGRWKDRVDSASGGFNLLVGLKRAYLPLYTYSIAPAKKNPGRWIVACSLDELGLLDIGDQRALVVVFSDPPLPPSAPTIIDVEKGKGVDAKGSVDVSKGNVGAVVGEKSLSLPLPGFGGESRAIDDSTRLLPPPFPKHMERLDLAFADLDPADYQVDYGKNIEPWDKSIGELQLTRDQAKSFWSYALKKYEQPWQVLILVDKGDGDRRAISAAMAVADMLRIPRTAIFLPGVENREEVIDEEEANKWVLETIKAGKYQVAA